MGVLALTVRQHLHWRLLAGAQHLPNPLRPLFRPKAGHDRPFVAASKASNSVVKVADHHRCCWCAALAQRGGGVPFTSSSPAFQQLMLQHVLWQVFVYITSSDNHDAHDVGMISYILLTIPWELGCISQTPPGHRSLRRRRIWTMAAFFGCIVPMVPLYIQHKFYRVPGAYSRYAYFEWMLIILDIGFDALAAYQLDSMELEVFLGGDAAQRRS